MSILTSKSFEERSAELIEVGRFFDGRGWAPATSGNYSARVDTENVAITVSGVHKGELTANELMLVDLKGEKVASHLDEQCSSAETLLHTQIYCRDE